LKPYRCCKAPDAPQVLGEFQKSEIERWWAHHQSHDLHAQHTFELLKDQDVQSAVEKIGDPAALKTPSRSGHGVEMTTAANR
jgi:hypothetical protein